MFKKFENFGKEAWMNKLPESVRPIFEKLHKAKSEDEKELFLKSLPEDKLKMLVKASAYTMLKVEAKLAGTLAKLNVKDDVLAKLSAIKEHIVSTGQEVTKKTVDAAVDALWATLGITFIVGSILVLFLLLTAGPSAGIGLFAATIAIGFLSDFVMFAPEVFFDRKARRNK